MAQSQHTPQHHYATRSKDLGAAWSTLMNPGSPLVFNSAKAETYSADFCPLIQVPDGSEGNQLVFRTWTMKDVKEATEHITRPEIDVEECIEGIIDLQANYHLDGSEMQQVLMQILGLKWHLVKGNWTPTKTQAGNAIVLKHDEVKASLELADGVFAKMRTMYVKKTDYTKISQTQQTDGESVQDFRARMHKVFKENSGIAESADAQGPFIQQLKMAILNGLKEPVRAWLQKNYVGLNTATMDDFITHAIHADKVIKDKKKKQATQIYMSEEGTETCVIQTKSNTPPKSNAQKGGQSQNRKMGNNQKETDRKDGNCYICHKKGHYARDCRQNPKNRTVEGETA